MQGSLKQPKRIQPQQTGAVLVFKPGIDVKEAQLLLGRLLGDVLEGAPEVQSFNPEYGQPAFYVP